MFLLFIIPSFFKKVFLNRYIYLFYRDEEMDGEWEAPQIPNPKCEAAPGCGVWAHPMMNNPNYKGKWKPPMIENPNYQVIATIVIYYVDYYIFCWEL